MNNQLQIMDAKFPLGHICITRNALGRISPEELFAALTRHARGDWGECHPETREENDRFLTHGPRLHRPLSVYHDRQGNEFWVTTAADGSQTWIFLREDY